jgi:hypothetical protein
VQFASVAVGANVEIAFPNDAVLTHDFSFAHPAQSATAMLQGFQLGYPSGDYELHDIRIELTTRFNPGQSVGSVEVHFALRDAQSSPGESGPITARVLVLVIGF